MQDQNLDPEQLIQQIEQKPYLLNQITQALLEEVSQSPGFTNSQTIESLMRELNEESTTIQRCLLLFNALRTIISDTFSSVEGLNQNKMYGWLSMIFALKCDKLVQELEILGEGLRQNMIQVVQWLQNACYGLLFCQMVVAMAEKSMKLNSGNRIFYPEMFRLLSTIIPKIQSFDIPNICSLKIKFQNENIMTTNILQQLHETKAEPAAKKSKKASAPKSSPLDKIPTICVLIVTKSTQLLCRSLTLCKKKTVQRLNIVTEVINGALQNLINEGAKDGQFQETTFGNILQKYLNNFGSGNSDHHQPEEIDEEDKIIQVKELTPRFVDEDQGFEIKKLRTKKKKLIKKIQSDAKAAKMTKLQQQKVLNDVRNQRIQKRQKKQLFVLQKQTQQAKKQHNKMKRIKQISKQGKNGKSGDHKKQTKQQHKRH